MGSFGALTILNHSKAVLPQPCLGDLWLHHFVGGGQSCAVRMFSSSPSFCPLEANIPLPRSLHKKVPITSVPWASESPRMKTTVLRQNQVPPSHTLLNGPSKQRQASKWCDVSAVKEVVLFPYPFPSDASINHWEDKGRKIS